MNGIARGMLTVLARVDAERMADAFFASLQTMRDRRVAEGKSTETFDRVLSQPREQMVDAFASARMTDMLAELGLDSELAKGDPRED